MTELTATVDSNPAFFDRLSGPRHLVLATVAASARSGGWGTPVPDLERARTWFLHRQLTDTAAWCANLLREAGVAPRRRGRSRVELPDHLKHYGITSREYDVLVLVAERLSNKEIAARLVVSPSTVKSHVERLLAKTGRQSRIELAELAQADPGKVDRSPRAR